MVLPISDSVNRTHLSVLDNPTLQVILVVPKEVLLVDSLALLLGECAGCN